MATINEEGLSHLAHLSKQPLLDDNSFGKASSMPLAGCLIKFI
jgi:hypothetical protein